MKWIRDIFTVDVITNLDPARIHAALNDPLIRRHWVNRVIEELRRINLDVDRLLENESTPNQFLALSARRKALLWALEEIGNAKTSVDLESHHNRDESDEPRAAVFPAPGR